MSEEITDFNPVDPEKLTPRKPQKGFLSKFKGLFQVQNAEGEIQLPPTREPTSAILARTRLPDREVSLDDISIYNLPVNWTATGSLATAINRLKETPLDRFEIRQHMPSPDVYAGIPWVASAIANHYNREIPVILPSADEIKAIKPWLTGLSSLIGRFSVTWQYRFNRFIEANADDKILNQSASNILRRVDTIGEIDHPKARFVPEVAAIYNQVAAPQEEEDDNFDPIGDLFSIFDDSPAKPKTRLAPIERKVENLVSALIDAKYGRGNSWINTQAYPLLTRAVQMAKFPPDFVDVGIPMASPQVGGIVGSEIMQGVEGFLRKRGMTVIPTATSPVRTFDLFDGNTWNSDSVNRSLAETFAQEKIRALKRELPDILTEVENVLPESGPAIMDSVRTLAENILILSKQGVSTTEIAQALFTKPQPEY